MDTIGHKSYPELKESLLDENSSLTKMLGLIGNNKQVVDFWLRDWLFCSSVESTTVSGDRCGN